MDKLKKSEPQKRQLIDYEGCWIEFKEYIKIMDKFAKYADPNLPKEKELTTMLENLEKKHTREVTVQ